MQCEKFWINVPRIFPAVLDIMIGPDVSTMLRVWAGPGSQGGNVTSCKENRINSLAPGQDGRHFADDIFRSILMNEKLCVLIKISMKFIRKGPIDNNPVLV